MLLGHGGLSDAAYDLHEEGLQKLLQTCLLMERKQTCLVFSQLQTCQSFDQLVDSAIELVIALRAEGGFFHFVNVQLQEDPLCLWTMVAWHSPISLKAHQRMTLHCPAAQALATAKVAETTAFKLALQVAGCECKTLDFLCQLRKLTK